MMGKLVTRNNGINKQFKPQIYQTKRRGQGRNFMINAIMIEEIIEIGTDQIAEIEEFSLVDKKEVDLGMNRITGMIITEEILEITRECIKILEDRIVEQDTEEIMRMKNITEKEVEVGLKKDIWTIIVEGEIGVVVIMDQGHYQKQVQIEIELGVISVENMITLQRLPYN